MKRTKCLSLAVALLIVAALLIGCSGSPAATESAAASLPAAETSAASESGEIPAASAAGGAASAPFELDLNDGTVYTQAGAEGEAVCSPSDLSLSEEEIQQLKDGNFKVAFCYHELEDQCNNSKLNAARAQLEDWGVEIVATTNADFSVEQQISDIESVLALSPDVVFVMPTDADALASTCNKITEAGSKLIFMEMSANIEPENYVGVVANDYYGVGVNCAHLLARALGYQGTVAMCYYDANWYSCTQRDDGFRATMAEYYPDIEIVTEVGFTDQNDTSSQGDAIFTTCPDVGGVYATWDVPMEGVIASAKSVGRTDLLAVAPDLSDNTARRLAEGEIMIGSVAPRSYDCGIAEAYMAAYALLGKELPAHYCAVPAQMITHENLAEAYKIIYNIDPPQEILDILNEQ